MKYQMFTEIQEENDVTNSSGASQSAAPPPLQTVLAAIYAVLRPHPDACAAVEGVVAQLLGPAGENTTATATKPTTLSR